MLWHVPLSDLSSVMSLSLSANMSPETPSPPIALSILYTHTQPEHGDVLQGDVVDVLEFVQDRGPRLYHRLLDWV